MVLAGSVRRRSGEETRAVPVTDFVEKLGVEIADKRVDLSV